MAYPLHPRIKLWLDLGGLLYDAAEKAATESAKALRPRRQGSYTTRKPGVDTPMWDVCASLLRDELKSYGSQARLARYLGVPRQRLHNFLKGRSRLPDAEVTLQMLNWLAQKRAGRDLSL
jgi:hypothetical protein